MSLKFRCYAHGRGRDWQAICIDLDLAVHGTSFQDVEASLDTAIQMYLETVSGLPSEEQRRFLVRRSPWHVRTKLAILTWLHHFNGDNSRARDFTLQFHTLAHS